MNPKAQPEQHPAADLLSAFAEHALPDPERARILAHMAGCARCREIVYLAQAAADPEPADVTTAANPGWVATTFAKWRVALIPAAALAAVGGIVLWVQSHPAPRSTETAQIASPPQPASASAPARMAPAPPPPSSPAPAAGPVHAVAPRPAPTAAKRAAPRSTATTIILPGLAGAGNQNQAFTQFTSSASAPMADRRFHGGIHLDGHSASMARFAPAQPARPSNWVSRSSQGGPEWQNNQQMADFAPGLNTQAPATPFASQAPTPGSVLPIKNELAAPATLDPAQGLQSSGQVERARSTNGFALLQLARRAPLPSGRNAVSSAALLNRLVVVDSGGSVFLSQDAGKHWETVAAQWSGRAIEVQAPPERLFLRAVATPGPEPDMPAPQTAAGTAEEIAPAPAPAPASGLDTIGALTSATATRQVASPPPPMLFKLLTDRHQTWVSADGKMWRDSSTRLPPPGSP